MVFKSYREIRDELGSVKTHTTIRNWMQRMFPAVFRAMGGDQEGNSSADIPAPPAQDFRRVLGCGIGVLAPQPPILVEGTLADTWIQVSPFASLVAGGDRPWSAVSSQ
jgi:hypothetical protein